MVYHKLQLSVAIQQHAQILKVWRQYHCIKAQVLCQQSLEDEGEAVAQHPVGGQSRFEAFIEGYNNDRPHQSL